jgi:uncharacterized protein (TIGR00369 family)
VVPSPASAFDAGGWIFSNEAFHTVMIFLARSRQSPPIAPMKVLPHTHSCFVCGESNPSGLNLRFETDGRIVRTRFTPRPEHIGFKEVVHGGLIATLLDEIMVWACAVATKRFAFCAELNVRFVNPARPGEPVIATAGLAANRRNKIFEATAELKSESGQLLASATGKYLPIRETDAAEMARDFVGDPRGI